MLTTSGRCNTLQQNKTKKHTVFVRLGGVQRFGSCLTAKIYFGFKTKLFEILIYLFVLQAPTSSAPAPAPAGGPPGPSGRATYRGGAAVPRPGMGGGEGQVPADELAKMSIGTGDAGQVKRRPRYTDPETKPAWITDKRGKLLYQIKSIK